MLLLVVVLLVGILLVVLSLVFREEGGSSCLCKRNCCKVCSVRNIVRITFVVTKKVLKGRNSRACPTINFTAQQ